MKLNKKKRKKQLKSIVSLGLVTLTMMSTLSQVKEGFAENNTEDNLNNETKDKKEKQATYRNVMYYGDWSVWGGQGNQYPKDLPADTYTHLNFAFLDFDSNGDLLLTDQDAAFGNSVGSGNTWGDKLSGAIPALIALKKNNPNMKLGISLGGWSKSGDFSEISKDEKKRTYFIKNVLKFIEYTDMDFVDVDWEFPNDPRQADKVDNKNDEGTPDGNSEDGKNYLSLMKDFRTALNKKEVENGKKYELSVALPGTKSQLEQGGVNLEELFKTIDFGNMMTYDMSGAWSDQTDHHSALYSNPKNPEGNSVDSVVKYLKSKNVQMDKVVIGAANYTRGWESVEKGNDNSSPGLFQKASIEGTDADQTPSRGAQNEAPLKIGEGGRKGGVWSYRSLDILKSKIPDLKEYWDDTAKAPYFYSEKTKDFYTFDNIKSVQEKAKYVKSNNLGGMISWQSSQDKDSTGNNVRDELVRSISNELFGESINPDYNELSENRLMDVSVKLSVAKTDSGKDGFAIKIQNNETIEAYAGDALKFADDYYSTIKKAKFIITMKDGSTLSKGDYKSGNVSVSNGKTIVDLSGVYDAKFINPGSSYEFKLNVADGIGVDVENIESIVMEQNYNSTTKLSSQVIYGKDNVPTENQKLSLSGVIDIKINVGDSFDPMDGVTAHDQVDGDVTKNIKVSGKVNNAKTGSYELIYSVSNSKGKSIEEKRTITVEKKEERSPEIHGISNKTIFKNDIFDSKLGVTATDPNGKDITDKIEISGKVNSAEIGIYELTYKVTSENGMEAKVSRKVTVIEEAAPTFYGVNNKTINVGDQFDVKADVSAIDGRGNIIPLEKITVNNTLDTTKPGKTTLTYTAVSENGIKATVDRVITVKEKDISKADEMVNPKNQVMVGYWHNWDSKNDGYKRGTALAMELKDIDSSYNVVNVSFMKASGDSKIPTFKPYKQSDEDFRKQIGELNAEGRSVLLALGGADAHIELTQNDKAAFIQEIIKLTDKYGFDGLDIDLEQNAITAAENQTVIPQALKEVKEHYAKEGKNFLITMAPEFPYLRGTGAYKAYIDGLKNEYDWINPQYYNQGGDGVSGENGQWLPQNSDDKKEDFLYYLTNALINGTDGNQSYVKIPSDKLVIGLPSNADAAGSGYVQKEEQLENALSRLEKAGNKVKGLMTWSVNWDNGLNSNGSKYEWEFANRYKDVIDYEGDGKMKPLLTGIEDVTLTVGDSFDPMNGVHAKDKDGKDLTSLIKVEGLVNTQKADIYKLNYSVEDASGQKSSYERTITVQDEKPPVFSGTSDVTLTVGDLFDPISGVGAKDVKGNDVTADIEILGTVDTNKVGIYELSYKVKSVSGKAEATSIRKVIVKDATSSTTEAWDSNKIYFGEEIVLFEGKEYKARWWTKGEQPATSQAWEEVLNPNDPTSMEWNSNREYQTGAKVTYEGVTYYAKWWTKGDKPNLSGQYGVWRK